MKNIIYIKHSDKRARSFQIQTMIVEENGKKKVIKEACYEEAKQHLANMFQYYKQMKSSSIFKPVETRYVDGVLEFDFIEGITVEQKLDFLLEEHRIDEAFLCIKHLFHQYEQYANLPFIRTKEFEHVFGDINCPNSGCLPITNIDFIFSNIMIYKWTLWAIDYEWMFDFLVPYRFIMYRSLYIYAHSSVKRKVLLDKNIMEYFHFSCEEQAVFHHMEDHFQRYVQGDYAKEKDCSDKLLKRNINIRSLPFDLYQKKASLINIVYDNGKEEQIKDISNSATQLVLKFHPTEGATGFRIELSKNSLHKIRRIVYDTECEKEIQAPYSTDMRVIAPNVFLSNEECYSLIITKDLSIQYFELFIDVEHVDIDLIDRMYQ